MVGDRHQAGRQCDPAGGLMLREMGAQTMRIVLGFILMIGFTAIGNVLMKLGASVPLGDRPIFGIVAWQTGAGIAIFAVAVIVYAILLQWLPLSVAQCFAALQFVAVILASTWVLGEPISLLRWIGVVLIAVGILTVGISGRVFEPTLEDGSP
jgi:drug/metabolite transporter (DMT)-like permease